MHRPIRNLALLLAFTGPLCAQQPAAPPATASRTLPEVVVTGQSTPTAYGPPAETNVTGLTAPERELPITINTVTDQFIKDTSSLRLRDLVGYVTGVNATEDTGSIGDSINIRGFDILDQSYINGMRNRIGYYASRSFRNIDHIDILKGPAGVEFGVGDPGGFVNYVTKKPQITPSYTIGAETGSYQYYDAYIDATGPLWTPAGQAAPAPSGKDAKNVNSAVQTPSQLGLFYRLIVEGESADSFRDTLHTDRILVAPSLLWNYADGGSLLLEMEYSHRNQPLDRGIVYLEGAGFPGNFAPSNLSYHEPTDYLDNNDTRTQLVWNQELNDHLKLRFSGQITTSHNVGNGVRNPNTSALYLDGTNEWNGVTEVPRTPSYFESTGFSYLLKPELLLNFDTGGAKHNGLFGFSYEYTRYTNATTDGFYSWPIDFKNPVYGATPTRIPGANPDDPNSLPATARDFRSREDTEEYGVYYQHKVDIGRLHLLGGARYDWYSDGLAFVQNVRKSPLPPLDRFSDQNFSWRVGGVFDVTKQVSLFAGYSRSYLPQSGILEGGGHADALEGSSFEGGIKASFLEDRVHATLSVFDIERKNLLEADPHDATGTLVIPVGTVRVPGVEFEVTGQVSRDLEVLAGFTYMNSDISDTLDPLTKGNHFHNVPQTQAGLRLRYDTSRWLIPGLSVGAGVVYVGDRPGDDYNSFTLPEYWRFDAGLYYQIQNWRFKLTCENLADRRYYLASQGFADTIVPGAPRTFIFGVEVKF